MPPPIHVHLESQHVTLCGHMIFVDGTSQGEVLLDEGEPCSQIWCPCKTM